MSQLSKRTLTAVFGIIALYFVLTRGGIILRSAIFILSIIGIFELKNAFKNIGINLIMPSIILPTILLFLLRISDMYFKEINLNYSASIFLSLIIAFIFVFREKNTSQDAIYSIFSFFYLPFIFNLINDLEGTYYIYLVFVIAFATDTFAYIVGVTMGRHKLIERVSPNKSVEGAIGGLLGSLLSSLALLTFLGISFNVYMILFLILASIVSQIGDLIASKIKRDCKIKDYGKIFPGHGGVLDRFDSILVVIFMVHILFSIVK